MRKTVYGQVMPFPWEPFNKLQAASLLTRYRHKGKRRQSEAR